MKKAYDWIMQNPLVPEPRPGENAAYIFTNDDLLPAAGSCYTIKKFKHYTVVSGMGTVNAP